MGGTTWRPGHGRGGDSEVSPTAEHQRPLGGGSVCHKDLTFSRVLVSMSSNRKVLYYI